MRRGLLVISLYNMVSTAGGSSPSNSTFSDEEPEKRTLMGEYQGPAAPSRKSSDEAYASDSPFQSGWRKRISQTRFRMGKMARLESFIRSFITWLSTQTPQPRNPTQSLYFRRDTRFLPPIPGLERLQKWLTPLFIFLLPTFIYKPASKPKKVNSMAYLDGLRGTAALFVMIHHYTCQFTPALLEGWGSDLLADGTNANRWFLQLPFFRVVHSGSFMVVLFFVISGCVLSRSGLKLARNRKRPDFMNSLASSIFRRWLRLHLPVIASMFVALVLSRMELWTHLKPNWLAPAGAPAWNETTIPTNLTIGSLAPLTAVEVIEGGASSAVRMLARTSDLADRKIRIKWDWTGARGNVPLAFQVADFAGAVVDVCDPFKGGFAPGLQAAGYNAGMILWTIPIEYLGSMVVFITLLGVGWTQAWFKLPMIVFLVIWCHYVGKWSLGTFLSGTFIAELTVIKESLTSERDQLPNDSLPAAMDEKEISNDLFSQLIYKLTARNPAIISGFWIVLWIVGIYIGSIPQINWGDSPGFVTLHNLIPAWYPAKDVFYPCLGAVFMMFAITYSPGIQSLFLTTFAQYLGRVSFSLYLLHTQILCSAGIRVMSSAMHTVGGGETYFQFFVGGVLGLLVIVPFTFWVADVFTRAVDEKSVAFARWFADRILVLA